jgi:hypothetical protein
MPHQQAGYMRAILSLSFAALDLAEREETIYGLNDVKPSIEGSAGTQFAGFCRSCVNPGLRPHGLHPGYLLRCCRSGFQPRSRLQGACAQRGIYALQGAPTANDVVGTWGERREPNLPLIFPGAIQSRACLKNSGGVNAAWWMSAL